MRPSEHGSAGEAGAPSPDLRSDAGQKTVLRVSGLTVGTDNVDLVIDVSFSIERGETLCLVGESGCGKSVTCLAAMGLHSEPVRRKAGSVALFDETLSEMTERQLAPIRGRDVAMIFQDPAASLNPVQRVGRQVAEVLVVHRSLSWRAAHEQAIALLGEVGIPHPADRADAYPHQLSGGMCQRVMIAMALACRPKLIIADEATTALDVTTQAQILRLMRTLQRETGTAMIFVTHDLSVVAEIADRVAVMYSGRIVESASADELFDHPAHPYTRGLMDCRLDAHAPVADRLRAIEGTVPGPAARPAGCAFRTRCSKARAVCAETPQLRWRAGSQAVACHFPESLQ